MTEQFLLTLNNIDVDDVGLVGRKAFNLATLHRNQLNVPPTLVITADFFEAQIDHYAYTPIWAGSPDVAVTEGALQFLADFLKSTPLAPPLEKMLRQKFQALFPPDMNSFAVRSSALDEDLQDRSFAGRYLTELGVPRDLVVVSLTRCWASALTGKAIQYRLDHGIPIQGIKIAAIIQPMLEPEAAGVGFTLNPLSGSRDEIVVEATPGLGESVVSGSSSPHRYHLARQYPIYPVLKTVYTNSPIIIPDQPDPTDLPPDPLKPEQLNYLAQTLEQIEALMGNPQDVEWAFADDKLHILQTRPITVVPPAPAAPETEWSRANFVDVLPDIPSPLYTSVMVRIQRRVPMFLESLGLDLPEQVRYLKNIYGRPYQNLSLLRRLLSQLGIDAGPLLKGLGFLSETNHRDKLMVNWDTMWTQRVPYGRMLRYTLKLSQHAREYQQTMRRLADTLRQSAENPSDVLAAFKLREQVYGDSVALSLVFNVVTMGLMLFITLLIAPVVGSAELIFRTLGTLNKAPSSVHHNQVLLRLAKAVQSQSEVLSYLLRQNNDFADYEIALKNTPFLQEFSAYLDEYGYRATYLTDMATPRYREQPKELLQLISQYARLITQGQLDDERLDAARSPKQAWRSLLSQASGLYRWVPWRQLTAYPVRAMLNRVMRLWEECAIAQAKAVEAIRQWDLAQAQKWVDQKVIEQVDDYFWLTMEEIEQALITEAVNSVHLMPTIKARRASYADFEMLSVPLVVREVDIPSLSLGPTASKDILAGTLVGLPVSPGQVQGVIRIVNDPSDLDNISVGSILVTPSNDPMFEPLFSLAGGLIVEMGGMLSHGSIIAREYGLPAVSNIIDARQRLKSGDRVLLDGSTGVVQILETKT